MAFLRFGNGVFFWCGDIRCDFRLLFSVNRCNRKQCRHPHKSMELSGNGSYKSMDLPTRNHCHLRRLVVVWNEHNGLQLHGEEHALACPRYFDPVGAALPVAYHMDSSVLMVRAESPARRMSRTRADNCRRAAFSEGSSALRTGQLR